MALDPSIALQFRGVQAPDPLAQYGTVAQIQGAQQANALRALQTRELEEGVARRNRLTAQLSTPEFAALNPEKQVNALVRGGFLTEARSLAESQSKVAKEQREAEKSAVDIAAANMKRQRDLLPAVKANPAAWASWRADTIKALPGLANIIPTEYSPAAADALMLEADKALEQHFVSQNLGGVERVVAMPKYGGGAAAVVPGSAAAVQPLPADVEAQRARIAQAGRAVTNINMHQESEFEKGLGAGQSKRVLDSRTAAEDAAEIMRTNQVGREILKSGAITGTGADFFVGFNNALKQAGIDFGYADAAANSQAYAAAMGANVGRIIKQFGAGTGLSDDDRKFAEQMAGGKITLDDKALRKILDINDRVANNVIDKHNKSVQGIKTNIPLTVEKPTVEPLRSTGAAQIPGQTSAPAAAPMYARNPQTGQRIMSVDGGNTWTPAR